MGKPQSKAPKYVIIPVEARVAVTTQTRPWLAAQATGGVSLLVLLFLLLQTGQAPRPHHPTADAAPFISDIYVVHSHRSPGARGADPTLCHWLARNGGELLAHTPCTPFTGFWAGAPSRDQIVDLIARRIVAPETHAKPQGPLTRLLYRLGLSAAAPPLFNEHEEVIDAQSLSSAASHALAWQNWTMSMIKRSVPPAERAKRLLLIFEDDANVTTDTVAALSRALPRLDPSFDILALDSADSFCSLSCWADRAMGAMGLLARRDAPPTPHLVRARTSFSRSTGVVLSYKGALQLFRYLPITRVSDLWERDLVTDRILNVYVACPRLVSAAVVAPALAVVAAPDSVQVETEPPAVDG
ncbi:hypothetical protein PLESTB_000451200 [Pleodorina starrii]|uniref:Uncharacterized protein n=1 Tax=Pleodorina starrii TaxID=330485 RepID=A0A9W6BGB6_9CHLO|nr:hypothetical protein PLESTM_000752600 [Pleodorina starrii]GLC50961.1 hypothetical protein PLESTB_000451200 [Pleodorina starrii]